MSDAALTLLVLGATIGLFAANRLPVGVVALGAALSLYALGVIDADTAFAGFGSQTVIFIASLFVVAEALDATGVTTWMGGRIVAATRGKRDRLLLALLVLAALLTALVTPNGAVAALLPMAVVVAQGAGTSPSQLLMPLAFAAHAGSLLVLTGSPVNVVVADAARDAGTGFGFLEFGLVGVPLVIGTLLVLRLLGSRLVPDRTPASMPPDLSAYARTLAGEYRLDEAEHVRREVPGELFTRDAGIAEAVVPPRSPLVGQTTYAGQVTDSGDLVVLAITRSGELLGPGEVTLAPGDTLLLEGRWSALGHHLGGDEVLAVDDPGEVRRRLVPMGRGARTTLAVVGAMVVLLATGAAPAAVCGVAAAMALVVLRVLTPEQAYRSVSWSTVVLVAGMLPMSTAITASGAADDLAGVVVDVVGTGSPLLLLAGLFVVTAVFGQAISNTATALIVIPIGLSAAAEAGVAAEPVLMCIAVASAAAFLTPIATPANMMVLGPGGYRFGDYWKLGLVLLGLFFVVAVGLVPLIWSP